MKYISRLTQSVLQLGLPITTCCYLVIGCSTPQDKSEELSAGRFDGHAEVIRGGELVVLEGATLIDGTGAASLEDSVVVLEGDRIVRVGKVGDFEFADDVATTDLAGRFIVPGFINTHAHVFETFPKLLLAHGITTIRNPGSGAEEGVPGASLGISLRDRLNAAEIPGPRMLTAGRIVNNSDLFSPIPKQEPGGDIGTAGGYAEVRSEEDIRAEVRRQANAGYDFLKLYMGIDVPLLRAAVDEASKHGIKVIGHLKMTTWTDAATSGIDGIMHSCSEGATQELLEPSVREAHDWSTWPDSVRSWAATANAIAFEGPRWEALIDALVTNGTEVNPTLATFEALYWSNDSAHLAREQLPFAPAHYADRWQEQWDSQRNFMAAQGFSEVDFVAFKAAFPACKAMILALHQRGILLTAGDDLGGWMTPGVSFHRELRLLAETGISNRDVIQIATRNGAEALGILDDVGTIEPGKRADLVILAGDPIADMRNTQSIVSVIHNGAFYDPGESLCANVRETGSSIEFNVEGGGVMMHDPLSQENAVRRILGNGRSA